MSGESNQKIFEEEREEGDEGWIDRFDNSRIYDEEREEYNRDEPSDSKDKWEEKGLKLEGYSLCVANMASYAISSKFDFGDS
jgi:hypothetical protein